MILWEKSDCSPDWTELLSILADLAKLTEKCSKNCGLLPYSNALVTYVDLAVKKGQGHHRVMIYIYIVVLEPSMLHAKFL